MLLQPFSMEMDISTVNSGSGSDIFFCILLVFIDLSYLQELLHTKRLYTTSYIGVIVIYKK